MLTSNAVRNGRGCQMDKADITQARMEAEEAFRELDRLNQPPRIIHLHCLDCGEPIHPVRQAHGFSTCVDCAEASERAAKMRRAP